MANDIGQAFLHATINCQINCLTITAHEPIRTEGEGGPWLLVEHLQVINRSMLNRLRPMALGHVTLRGMLSEAGRRRRAEPVWPRGQCQLDRRRGRRAP